MVRARVPEASARHPGRSHPKPLPDSTKTVTPSAITGPVRQTPRSCFEANGAARADPAARLPTGKPAVRRTTTVLERRGRSRCVDKRRAARRVVSAGCAPKTDERGVLRRAVHEGSPAVSTTDGTPGRANGAGLSKRPRWGTETNANCRLRKERDDEEANPRGDCGNELGLWDVGRLGARSSQLGCR
jgi:hypothetical protein